MVNRVYQHIKNASLVVSIYQTKAYGTAWRREELVKVWLIPVLPHESVLPELPGVHLRALRY